ncbi:hypothetical protein B0H14DRAFT_3477400 [Mycena olivaceomarginata]|nr:hypothetical protein B0H14DRAFT_3477400 [Mycena olivaceomarginata]
MRASLFPTNILACQQSQVGDSARSISSSWVRTTGTNWTSISQKSKADTKKITKVFCKLLDEDQEKHGKTNKTVNETAVDEFQQGVDDLIDIAVINTATREPVDTTNPAFCLGDLDRTFLRQMSPVSIRVRADPVSGIMTVEVTPCRAIICLDAPRAPLQLMCDVHGFQRAGSLAV